VLEHCAVDSIPAGIVAVVNALPSGEKAAQRQAERQSVIVSEELIVHEAGMLLKKFESLLLRNIHNNSGYGAYKYTLMAVIPRGTAIGFVTWFP
jgi:hypothetical protein